MPLDNTGRLYLERQIGRAELLFDQADGAADAASGNVAFGEAFEGAERYQVAEAVKPLAPARLRTHQPEPFPVAKTARLNP